MGRPGPRAPRREEEAISSNRQAGWDFAEAYAGEDAVLVQARHRAREVGVTPISPGGGAALCFLAAATGARAVAEIGTGTGVSGVHLLRGMRADGVLTTVDLEPDHQRIAKETYAEAGFSGGRARFIPGPALEVLPRLADGGYDLVFCDGDKSEYGEYLAEALRLLRPGGLVCFDDALWHDRVADPAHRDAESTAVRDVLRSVRENDALVPALLPVGDGLLCAVKKA
ncbi:O-methyltransferase [Yinghuangia seranimata]|uniref:O-methyltransferase n=1 Tax=Yinghuangia seranimata TaxID=408067 RepID=UPI00248B6882|nr:O-methyltransferase [Yinghuangia seranimata]MDI2128946.1 O-methyltransferase [Yinghuangia seranimata]